MVQNRGSVGVLDPAPSPVESPISRPFAVPSAVVFDTVSFAFHDHVVLRDVSFSVPKGSMKIPRRERCWKIRSAQTHSRPASTGLRSDRRQQSAHRENDRAGSDGRQSRHRDDVSGQCAVRFDDGRRERGVPPLRRNRYAAGSGPEAGPGGPGIRRSRGIHRLDTIRAIREASVAVSRSPGRWPQSRAFCYSTIRRPGSIRLRLPRSTTRS